MHILAAITASCCIGKELVLQSAGIVYGRDHADNYSNNTVVTSDSTWYVHAWVILMSMNHVALRLMS